MLRPWRNPLPWGVYPICFRTSLHAMSRRSWGWALAVACCCAVVHTSCATFAPEISDQHSWIANESSACATHQFWHGSRQVCMVCYNCVPLLSEY